MTKIRAVYWTSVYKPQICGWRQEKVEAILELISEKRAKVIEAHMEDGGSKRQSYNVWGAERNEVGKVKIVSKLQSVEMI